jgi:integrase/recombinase XerC
LTVLALNSMITHPMRASADSLRVSDDGHSPGAAALHLTAGLGLLRPEEQAFAAMLDGWGAQQIARRLSPGTLAARWLAVGAFAAHAEAFPWSWMAQLADEWFTDLRAARGLRASTLHSYQDVVGHFCGYVTDPAYDWPAQCLARFGTHPVQVCHEWNTAVYVQDAEADPAQAGIHPR